METKTYLFQLTVPSVQKFISSSRKSSDLWAGSFMVSYLMKELLKIVVDTYQAELIYPVIENTQENEKELIANIPNVAIFKIENDNPEIIKSLLQDEFQKLLNEFAKFGVNKFFEKKVEDEYIKKAFNIKSGEKLNEKKEERNNILDRERIYEELAQYQIKKTLKLYIEFLKLENLEGYKKISEDLANLINYDKKSQLTDRKYFENYKLIEPANWDKWGSWENFYENGLKKEIISKKDKKEEIENLEYLHGVYRCSSCGEHTIIGATLDDWRGNTIWKPLWEANPKIFNKGERLCGVCLAKRYFREYIGGEDLGFPSTSEIGATLFKKEILEIFKNKKDDKLEEFLLNLGQFFNLGDTKGNYVKKLSEELKDINPELKSFAKGLLNIDGEWFLEDTWKNENDYKMIGADDKKANQMLKALEEISKYLENKGNGKYSKPSEYYAVIMLDGDSIGEKLDKIKDIKTHRNFSKALSELSKEFQNIVEENYGALIYSGGDDVLALVPVEKALDCANEIQKKFKTKLKNEFPDIDKESPFSMSGAIIYAHYKSPLSYILEEARKCEEKAKEEGKNRICLKYIKSSLANNEFILNWNKIRYFKYLICKPTSTRFIYQLKEFSYYSYRNNKLREKLLLWLLKKKNEDRMRFKLFAFKKIFNNYIEINKLRTMVRITYFLNKEV